MLRCSDCKTDVLPDKSRAAIIYLHEQALKKGVSGVNSTRRKPSTKYDLTAIPFDYDSDDYEYLPGLYRAHDPGFLTPVFFNRTVLMKYDAMPDYNVQLASTTYGTIYGPCFYISFGINSNDKIVMWLGDIAGLPEKEQYYLRSENVVSDHCIGSEFYDGQIGCIFTEPSIESALFRSRSDFLQAVFARFGVKFAHLDNEVLELADSFSGPLAETMRERQRIADTLNKVYVESLDSKAIGAVLLGLGGNPKDLGTLKRLQAVLELISVNENVPELMLPFFTVYDFRVAALHLTSAESAMIKMKSITDRLVLREDASLSEIYSVLLAKMTGSFYRMAEMMRASSGR